MNGLARYAKKPLLMVSRRSIISASWIVPILVILFFVGTPSPAAYAAYHIAVHFEEAGQVCPSLAEGQRLRAALLQLPPMIDAPITLVTYSDQIEMRSPNWQGNVTCVKASIPDIVTGHDRIAWLRAMAIIEMLREAKGCGSDPAQLS